MAKVAIAAASLLTLSACTFGNTSTGAASGSKSASTTLRVANPTAIVSLDPYGATSAALPTLAVTQEIFQTLVTRQDGKITPSLATKWENPDELTWDFTLKEGVKFADGTALTAEDVKASFDHLIAGKGPLVSIWAAVSSVEAPSATKFVIHTKTPLGTVLSNLTLLPIGPSEKLTDADYLKLPYGSGPFRATAFTPGQKVVLDRNPEYAGTKPWLTEISYTYIPDVSGRVTALRNGEIDATWGLPVDQLDSVKSDDSLKAQTFATNGNYYIWFNSSRAPFTDVKVRQAMRYAIDMPAIAKALFNGSGEIATGPIAKAVFGSAPQTAYEHDPVKAKKLLTEAGYPNGLTTTMMYSDGANVNGDNFAAALVSDWAKAGITVQLQKLEPAVWLQKLLALDWDSTMNSGNTITGDADFTLGRLYLSTAKRTGYSNPALDTLLLQARAAVDQAKRATLYKEAGKIIWDDAVGVFPLDLNDNVVLRSNVKGFVATPNDLPDFASVSVE